MGCGASAKPSHQKGSKYTPKGPIEVKPPEDTPVSRNDSRSSNSLARKPSADSNSTKASTNSKSSTDSKSWHKTCCTDADVYLVKTIEEAFPFDDTNRKTAKDKNNKGYGDVSVVKMGPKKASCGACAAHILNRYEEKPFYYCIRCRKAGHKTILCVSCYDGGELATGPRKMTPHVACKNDHYSYALKPSLHDTSPESSDAGEPVSASPAASPRNSRECSPRPSQCAMRDVLGISDSNEEESPMSRKLSVKSNQSERRVSSKSPQPSPRHSKTDRESLTSSGLPITKRKSAGAVLMTSPRDDGPIVSPRERRSGSKQSVGSNQEQRMKTPSPRASRSGSKQSVGSNGDNPHNSIPSGFWVGKITEGASLKKANMKLHYEQNGTVADLYIASAQRAKVANYKLSIEQNGNVSGFGPEDCTLSGRLNGTKVSWVETHAWGTLRVNVELVDNNRMIGQFTTSDSSGGVLELGAATLVPVPR